MSAFSQVTDAADRLVNKSSKKSRTRTVHRSQDRRCKEILLATVDGDASNGW